MAAIIAAAPIPTPNIVGQPVPVTGISLGVANALGVAEADAVEVGVADAVAVGVARVVGVGVRVGVGVATAHNVISVVQDAPRDGQQKRCVPQVAICPTFPKFEQLISCGEPSELPGLQFLSKVGCPETGHDAANGQILAAAFSEIFCCCLTKTTPATMPSIKKTTMQTAITIDFVLTFLDLLLVTISKGDVAELFSGMFIIILYQRYLVKWFIGDRKAEALYLIPHFIRFFIFAFGSKFGSLLH